MRKSALLLVAIAIMAILGGIARSRPAPPITATVRFVHLTNSVTGEMTEAIVAITNTSSTTLRRMGFYEPESRSRTGTFVTHSFDKDLAIGAGQSEAVIVPVPDCSSNGTRRAVFWFSRNGLRERLHGYSGSWPWLYNKLPPPPAEQIPSDWITP
jgi:hypothetical protein